MFTDTRKFKKEIEALKSIKFGPALHPLKKEQIKQAVLLRLHTTDELVPQSYAKEEKKLKFMRLAVPVSAALLMIGGTAFAANNAKPGDVLFPVKKAAEQIIVRLAPTEEGKANFQAEFARERLRELSEINNRAKINAGSTPGREIPGQARAQDEVKNALSDLQAAEANLQAKGNLNAAAEVQKTLLQLRTSLQANEAGENNQQNSQSKSSGNQTEGQKATSTAETRLQGQAATDKKNKGQQKNSDNENTAGLNAPGNKNSGPQNGLATSTPIIFDGHNQDNQDNQENRNNSQEHNNATSSAQSAVAQATSTQANSKPPASEAKDSQSAAGTQANPNLQNNPPLSSNGSGNQASNNQTSGSQGTGSNSSANLGSGSQTSGNGSSNGTVGGSSSGDSGGRGSSGGAGSQSQHQQNGESDHSK